jgi:hypothetical protein
MLLACVIEDDTLLAILPLMHRDDAYWYCLKNHFTSRFSLLIAADASEAVFECLATGLQQLPFLSLRLESVAEHDASLQRLLDKLQARGFQLHRYLCFFNWVNRLEQPGFAAFMAGRPAHVRNTIARKARRLQREHATHIQLFTTHDLARAIAEYNAIYRASWKASESYAACIEALVHRCAAQGWLRLAILYIDAQPAAAHIWFVAHGKANIFRLVYDEQWRCYSPGSILMRYLLQHAIDIDKATEIDFLIGNERYKQDWMSLRQQCWGIDCVQPQQTPGFRARLRTALRRLLPGWRSATRFQELVTSHQKPVTRNQN